MAVKLIRHATSTSRRPAHRYGDRDVAALPRSSRFRSHDEDSDEDFSRLRTARYQGFDGESPEDTLFH